MKNIPIQVEVIDTESLFKQGTSKINQYVKLSKEDIHAHVKILCKEQYAQEVYDTYFRSDKFSEPANKDLTVGTLCKVIARRIDFENKQIEAQDIKSLCTIFVPFSEFTEEPQLLIHNEIDLTFSVIIYKADNGSFYGSERKCAAIIHREELDDFFKNSKWFYVTIVSLVKGGYLATYKGTTNCFIPGSHAAANIIRDFNEYLGKEIPVMIESYDSANNLYIASYKKYIKQTLPQEIYKLRFGEKYIGELTTKPYDFGMFIEFNNYFTGLLHKTEFENYDEIIKSYKAGDKIEFYIKEIIIKKGEPRIILTNSLTNVSQDQISWQYLKDNTEGKCLEYTFNRKEFTLDIDLPETDQVFTTDVSHLRGTNTKIKDSGQVTILRVDIFRKHIKFEFM